MSYRKPDGKTLRPSSCPQRRHKTSVASTECGATRFLINKPPPKPDNCTMPAAGEGRPDKPKRPIGKAHYEHYCAGVFDFDVEQPAKVCQIAEEKRGRKAGKMSEDEYYKVREHLGHTLASKFKTCRRAFRLYDDDHSGSIGRPEVRKLFHYNGYGEKAADRFFNKMDADGSGIVAYDEFIDVFAHYIQPTDDLKDYSTICSVSSLAHNGNVLKINKADGHVADYVKTLDKR